MTSSDTSGALVPFAEHIATGPRPEQGPGLVDRIRAAWLLAQPSEHTREAYARDFDTWRGFLDGLGLGVDVLAARRTHVDAWARVREASRDAPATLARRLAAVSAFYSYAAAYVDEHALGVDVTNPVALVRRPRRDAGRPRGRSPLGSTRACWRRPRTNRRCGARATPRWWPCSA